MQENRVDATKKEKPTLYLWKRDVEIASDFKFEESGQIKLSCVVSGINKQGEKNSYDFSIVDIKKIGKQARIG